MYIKINICAKKLQSNYKYSLFHDAMDIHQIYSSWLKHKLPTEKHVQYFTVMEKPCELEFIAMLLRDAGQKVEVTPDPVTMEKIPHVWSVRVSDVFVINVAPENVELRVFLESINAPPYERVEHRADDIVDAMSALTLKSADFLMMSKSKPRIHAVANMLDARVSTGWVQLCASRLEAVEPSFEFYQLDRSKFKLISRDPTDRHVHHINSSVLDFLRELQKKHVDERGRQLTVTWQFSYDPAGGPPIKYAIHLQKFRAAMQQLASANWFEFTLILCAIGLPIHELAKPRTIVEQWKRFRQLSQENITKVLLRPHFPEATTVPELVRLYGEKMGDLKCQVVYDDIRQHFFKTFYSWPTTAEIESLMERIQKNASEWSI